jgi:Nuclease-related domain
MMFLAISSVDPLHFVSQTLEHFLPWLFVLGLLSLLGALLMRRFRPKLKGFLGEWAVNRGLLKNLDTRQYRVLRDLLLPDGKGGQTQIDHVVVSAYGLFVIETKNWDCWIFGDEKGRHWTLSYRGGRKTMTLNPLHQNAGHVNAVCALLGIRSEHCHNLVFINPVSKLKNGPIPGVFLRGMLGHIQSFQTVVFDPAWVQSAVAQLMSASKSDDKVAVAAHLAQVQLKQGAGYV